MFLRGNGKLPDYIEVGTGLWFAAHDWHIRWQQPITMGRDAIGRVTLLLLSTLLMLRHDAQGNFMSLPYDQGVSHCASQRKFAASLTSPLPV